MALGVVAALLVVAPSAGSDTCVRSVDASAAGAGAEAALRAAVAAAAAPVADGHCAAWRIDLVGTFVLTDDLVWDTPAPLHVAGPADGMARLEAAGAGHRLLTVALEAAGAPVTLERLVLAGGDVSEVAEIGADEGGAVLADVLHLVDVELVGNAAVVGGAVLTRDLTATRTSFVGNAADLLDGLGGAVYATGQVTLTNVTFAGNVAKSGGAVHLDVSDSGAGSLTATFVTFLDNEAATGADLHLVGTDPAVFPVTLRGVLLAGPASGLSCAGTRFGVSAPVLTGEASLVADASCTLAADDRLAGLMFDRVAFRTGTTDLFLPVGTWAGRDAVDCTSGWPTNDQRGAARPQGTSGRCDVGAVERIVAVPDGPPVTGEESEQSDDPAVATSRPVPTSVPAGDGGCAAGSCSLLSGRGAVPARPR